MSVTLPVTNGSTSSADAQSTPPSASQFPEPEVRSARHSSPVTRDIIGTKNTSLVTLRRSVSDAFPRLAKRASGSISSLASPAVLALRALQTTGRQVHSDPGDSAGPVRQSTFVMTRHTIQKLDAILAAKPIRSTAELKFVPPQKFIGPLAQLYPNGRIAKPVRFDDETWNSAMNECSRWAHCAELSGLTTYWQAVLLSAQCIKDAVYALKTISGHCAVNKMTLETVAFSLGKLTNTISLSWNLDHVANISTLRASESNTSYSFMNEAGIKHRHDRVLRKAWKMLDMFHDLLNMPQGHIMTRQTDITELVSLIASMYDDFYVYLIYTAQIVLENALFSYRMTMNTSNFSCVGKAATNAYQKDQILSYAEVILVGATPHSQRYARLRAMGYDMVGACKAILFGSIAYQRTFVKPLNEVIMMAERLEPSLG